MSMNSEATTSETFATIDFTQTLRVDNFTRFVQKRTCIDIATATLHDLCCILVVFSGVVRKIFIGTVRGSMGMEGRVHTKRKNNFWNIV